MKGSKQKRLAQAIKKQIRVLSNDMLAFVQDLVRIPTENPPGLCYAECVRLIAQRLNRFGLRTKILRVHTRAAGIRPRYCLLSSYGKGMRTVYFHGHYDVVPGSERHQFSARIKGNRLYGRGTADMKGGLAAMVYAVHVLQRLDIRLPGRLCLAIVPDEETGGRFGTQYLFKHGYIKEEGGSAMLMPEPTGGAVWNACRGAISLMIRIKGTSVHVVLQNKGTNAFEQMVGLSSALLKLKHCVERKKTKFTVAPGESRNSILMLGGMCRGGANFNIVPDECSFTVERRINPEEDFKKEKARLLNVLDRFRRKGMRLEIEVIQEGESVGISSDHYLAGVLVNSIKAISGRRPKFYMCPGLLEIRYYLKRGIPAFAYGPGLLTCAHSPDEFVDIERIYDCAAVYALAAINLLSGDDT